ncbi:MAG: hypothetical protein LBO75_04635 [Bifidobacteriaceae bacterium]|nr:hypothetical protein [Bifidobacteriaceae bacterium]
MANTFPPSNSPEELVAQIDAVTPLADVEIPVAAADGSIVSTSADSTITIPKDASSPITIAGDELEDATLEIGLPDLEDTDTAGVFTGYAGVAC